VDEGEGQHCGTGDRENHTTLQGPGPAAQVRLPDAVTYQLGHDFTFKAEQRVSVRSLDGRVIVSYTGYDRHVALIRTGARIGAAKLW
jgi:hypothetical protein